MHIGVKHRLPFRNLELINIDSTRTDTRIVEKKINPAKARDSCIKKSVYLFGMTKICRMALDGVGPCIEF